MSEPSSPSRTLRVAITGATGLIGSALAARLCADGHTVLRVTRSPRQPQDVGWEPERGWLDAARLGGVDAAVHLAGEPIGERWTAARKAAIRSSRVDGTRLLATALARLEAPPQVLLSASAVGIYGDRADEPLDERSATGADYLADVGRAWEEAAEPAARAGVRVVHPRFGIALSPDGGALARMLPVFRLGGGGRLGSGAQWMSWIALADVVEALVFLLQQPALRGAVNLTAPEPVTNAEFTRVLARVLHRPAPFAVPAFALRLAFGEMADAALLASQRALPRRLLDAGFVFRYPTLEAALRAMQLRPHPAAQNG